MVKPHVRWTVFEWYWKIPRKIELVGVDVWIKTLQAMGEVLIGIN